MIRLSGRDILGIVLVTALAASFVVSGVAQREPDTFKWLFGTVGILPFLAGLGTLSLLFVGARHAQRTLEHAGRAEIASRFQKAAEMLDKTSISTRVGGLTVMRDVALQDPANYLAPALQALQMSLVEIDANVRLAVLAAQDPDQANWAMSNPLTTRTLKTISALNLRPSGWDEGAIQLNGKLMLQHVYLHQQIVHQVDFRNCIFRMCVFGAVVFESCDFRGAQIRSYVHDHIKFIDCDLTGVEIVFTERQSGKAEGSDKVKAVFSSGCKADQIVVKGAKHILY